MTVSVQIRMKYNVIQVIEAGCRYCVKYDTSTLISCVALL